MARLQQAHSPYDDSRVAAPGASGQALLPEPVLWKLVVISALAYLLWCDKISIVFGPVYDTEPSPTVVRASIFDARPTQGQGKSPNHAEPAVGLQLPASERNNLSFAMDPGFAKRNGIGAKEVTRHLARCRDYIERYAPLAQAEMEAYGIPASVTLAQALVESNAGESRLAQKANNHFGIKCFSKRCKKGHCLNFSDDSHKDFFQRYDNAWASYRAHSEFLKKTARYKALFKLGHDDYRGWALGIAKAGYATDPHYAAKLIATIRAFRLDRYDRTE
jgi:hypothetical protein